MIFGKASRRDYLILMRCEKQGYLNNCKELVDVGCFQWIE